MAHDQESAARRYRQLAGEEILARSFARRMVDEVVSGDITEESKAEILKILGAPEWSELYKTMDQPTAESWTDWQVRRQVLADA